MEPLIVTCAVTGGANVPSLSAALPFTPEDLVASALGAARAGAAILHLHARDPRDGRPSNQAEHFAPVLAGLAARTDAVVALTIPGSPAVPVGERLACLERFAPEMAAFVTGTSNYAFDHRLPLVREWRFAWEPEYLRASRNFVYQNTLGDCDHICATLNRLAIRPELEIFGPTHLYNLVRLVEEGRLAPPLHLEFVLGLVGGVRPDPEDLVFLLSRAERLLGRESFTWSLAGMVGCGRFGLFPLAVALGGHVRIGLEDNVCRPDGRPAQSNAELVEYVAGLAREAGRPLATPGEARRRLGLKGRERVAFLPRGL